MRIGGVLHAVNTEARIADTAGGEEQMTELAALQHCLETLEEQARACIVLAYYEGY